MKVAISGGCGSIGFATALELLNNPNNEVLLLDNSEHSIFVTKSELQKMGLSGRCKVRFADVREEAPMLRHFQGYDLVFHCAALKHVPLCEEESNEAFKTNVMGTHNAIKAAEMNNCKFLLMSTDKAVGSSVMGQTKYNAEKDTLSQGHTAIRSGNALGSRGCFFDAAIEQIESGLCVKITDVKMDRYIIHLDDLARFIVRVMKVMGNKIYIPIMEEVNVFNYLQARGMKENYELIGARKGEVLKEKLFYGSEHRELKDWCWEVTK